MRQSKPEEPPASVSATSSEDALLSDTSSVISLVEGGVLVPQRSTDSMFGVHRQDSGADLSPTMDIHTQAAAFRARGRGQAYAPIIPEEEDIDPGRAHVTTAHRRPGSNSFSGVQGAGDEANHVFHIDFRRSASSVNHEINHWLRSRIQSRSTELHAQGQEASSQLGSPPSFSSLPRLRDSAAPSEEPSDQDSPSSSFQTPDMGQGLWTYEEYAMEASHHAVLQNDAHRLTKNVGDCLTENAGADDEQKEEEEEEEIDAGDTNCDLSDCGLVQAKKGLVVQTPFRASPEPGLDNVLKRGERLRSRELMNHQHHSGNHPFDSDAARVNANHQPSAVGGTDHNTTTVNSPRLNLGGARHRPELLRPHPLRMTAVSSQIHLASAPPYQEAPPRLGPPTSLLCPNGTGFTRMDSETQRTDRHTPCNKVDKNYRHYVWQPQEGEIFRSRAWRHDEPRLEPEQSAPCKNAAAHEVANIQTQTKNVANEAESAEKNSALAPPLGSPQPSPVLPQALHNANILANTSGLAFSPKARAQRWHGSKNSTSLIDNRYDNSQGDVPHESDDQKKKETEDEEHENDGSCSSC
eukprot:m.139377 g.139377  ORF g.139377 m.139377 type:complete len:579 (-) comp15943_c1_seq1:129-1865(-)